MSDESYTQFMEWFVSKLEEMGVRPEIVDFDRVDIDSARSGDIKYLPYKMCSLCKGTGKVKFKGRFDQNDKEVDCSCTDITICGHCGGTGEVAVDVDDGEGHTMRGVGTATCICRKLAKKDREESEY